VSFCSTFGLLPPLLISAALISPPHQGHIKGAEGLQQCSGLANELLSSRFKVNPAAAELRKCFEGKTGWICSGIKYL